MLHLTAKTFTCGLGPGKVRTMLNLAGLRSKINKKYAYGIIGGVVVLGGVGVGTAYASIPDSGGVIHGCYKPQGNGSNAPLGVIDTALSNGHCPSGDTELTWNQTGPQGPQGVTGATGATGPQGPAGPS